METKTIEQQIEKFLCGETWSAEKMHKYSYTHLITTTKERFEIVSRSPLAVNVTLKGNPTGVIFENNDRVHRVERKVKFWKK